MLNTTNKKAHNSSTLAGAELQASTSTYVDEHNDRIARLATLKIGQSNKKIIYGRLLHLIPIKTQKTKHPVSPQNPLTSLVNAVTICCSKTTTP